jgi:hypothetical protein
MRAHLPKVLRVPVAMLGAVAVVLAIAAPVAQAAVIHGRHLVRGGITVNGARTGATFLVVSLVLLGVVVGASVWAIVADRRSLAPAGSSSEPARLPTAHGDTEPEQARKAA